MRTILKILFIILVLLSLSGRRCEAQWQTDVRLTNDPAASVTSYNNAWCIAVSGNVVHTVWWDLRNDNREIYYKRSTDAGLSWEDEKRLTNNTAESYNPSIAAAGNVVHIVWQDYRDGNEEIYYKRSSDGGANWGADTRLTNSPSYSTNPSISVYAHHVHIVWDDYRDGNYEIYHKRSTNGGLNWEADKRLTNNSAYSTNPSAAVFGNIVHTVWEDDRDANYEIYYKRSTDGGFSWGVDTRFTHDMIFSVNPSVAVSGTLTSMDVHIVWSDESYSNYEIFYKHSSNGGINWFANRRLTNNSEWSSYPSVSAYGSVVHVVWEDNRDDNREIYYKRSLDSGYSWGTDTRLTNDTADSNFPSVSVSYLPPEPTVHIVWNDRRPGNREIYYKRNPTGNPFGVMKISSEVPAEYSLSQNYPNPFNPKTKIRFSLPRSSGAGEHVKLEIYDALGRLIKIIVDEELKAGIYEADFDSWNISSGIYLYKLTAKDFSETKKMIVVK